jgi:hypothetical protein
MQAPWWWWWWWWSCWWSCWYMIDYSAFVVADQTDPSGKAAAAAVSGKKEIVFEMPYPLPQPPLSAARGGGGGDNDSNASSLSSYEVGVPSGVRRFIILTTQRSGSGWLLHKLASRYPHVRADPSEPFIGVKIAFTPDECVRFARAVPFRTPARPCRARTARARASRVRPAAQTTAATAVAGEGGSATSKHLLMTIIIILITLHILKIIIN